MAGPARPAMPARARLVRFLSSLPHWIFWVLCVLLVIPALLGVPGQPEPWEIWLYLAVLAAVTHYPVLLPVFAVLEVRARRAGKNRRERVFRRAIWTLFGLAALPVATLAGIMYANAPPPPTQAQRVEGQLSTAILYDDLDALRALLEGGLDIEHRTFGDGTPATDAALHRAWTILAFLLEQGANPDHADMNGWTARSQFEKAEPPSGNGDDARAHARVRELLDERPAAKAPAAE